MNSSEARKTTTLVLHLAANPNPISIKITPDAVADLETRLVQIVRNGHTHAVATADGKEFVVNFSHVVAAHFA
jgi:hypothetical protein